MTVDLITLEDELTLVLSGMVRSSTVGCVRERGAHRQADNRTQPAGTDTRDETGGARHFPAPLEIADALIGREFTAYCVFTPCDLGRKFVRLLGRHRNSSMFFRK